MSKFNLKNTSITWTYVTKTEPTKNHDIQSMFTHLCEKISFIEFFYNFHYFNLFSTDRIFFFKIL